MQGGAPSANTRSAVSTNGCRNGDLLAHIVRLGRHGAWGQGWTESGVFQNKMPRYDVLSEDAMAALDRGWRRLVSEIGVEFMSDRALDLFRAAGQRVEGETVFLDPVE